MPQQRTEAPASTAAKRCVIYCRKSSSEGLDRNYTSIDAQRDTCLRFIESHAGDGWQYTGQVFEDGGFSGGTTDRPAFQRMMRDVRNGEIDIIVIYKLDRTNRNKRDFWNIEHELRQHGVEIACATQSIELKTSTGRATTGIMMDFAELEREMDSERILGQLRAARAAGRWSAAATPYGYRKNEDSELVVDEPKAEAIRFIFERYPVMAICKSNEPRL